VPADVKALADKAAGVGMATVQVIKIRSTAPIADIRYAHSTEAFRRVERGKLRQAATLVTEVQGTAGEHINAEIASSKDVEVFGREEGDSSRQQAAMLVIEMAEEQRQL